ncbi:Glycoside hydrolase, 38 vacuolar alpha mannosidase [Elasticomyces elasticus]|nr:Glycoside hydrolase, 38 vacuolar alpha mannosidase [Elasticomyces elasticus]
MGGDTRSNMSSASTYPVLASRPVGKQIHSIYRDRLQQFADNGQYKEQGILSKLYEGRASGEPHIKLSVYSPPDLSRPTFKEATSSKNEFRSTKVGEAFGPSWSTHWFRVALTVPPHLLSCASKHLELHWDAGNEGLVWSERGEPLQGLTGGGERVEWILPKEFKDGREHVFYVEMACNGMFGNAPGGDSIQPPKPDRYFTLREADVVAVDLEARALHLDFWIIGDAAREFPEDTWEEHEALQVCNSIMDCFIAGKGSHDCIVECRKIAKKYLGDDVDSAKVYDNDKEAIVSGIGHCHIDTCWLWPWAETKRKIARSWSNQCDLLDRYPEHRFCASQAQQYKWLEQLYPTVYDRVKNKVKEGTFQPIGGSWVEHDTNMPSGESLVRQFLYGQRFFESRFGQRCSTFWLPDTFGYSTQLPQLCRLAGMSRFFTQKLSWNNINNFPHTTFNWVSLDGSQVLCHMTPAETYTAEAHFGDVKRSVTQHKSMDQDSTSLLVFGKGDGGGGPTFQHIEKLRRCRGISDKIGLLPRVKMGDSVDDFFARLERKAERGTEYATWYGELYFELHRGTYTTQANNKRNNRKAEILLHDVEYLATLASIKPGLKGAKNGYKYPKRDIDDMWENVLLCQFHDCLPGSSIEMCYDDSDELYAKVFATGEKLLADAMSALGFDQNISNGSNLVGLNTFGWARSEIAVLPSLANTPRYGLVGGDPGITPVQLLTSATKSTATIKELKKGVFILQNSQYKVRVENGVITSLYDIHAKREYISEGGKANQLVIFDDKPLYWQAWDVEVYHLSSRQELSASGPSSIVESGPHRVSVSTTTKISEKSWIKTTISLSAVADDSTTTSPICIDAEIEWRETMKFLKVEFPTRITSASASYETQFGIVRRPTHYNTSWDMAKFEVCTHKWADLSENGYGVSILNDSKYGFATCGNLMRLSLLRAPKAPDAHADMGRHKIRYAILPHAGALDDRTVRAGFNFNNPLVVEPAGPNVLAANALFKSLAIHGAPSLILDVIKRGEDDADVSYDGVPTRPGKSVILRVYESLGGKARGSIETTLPVKKAFKCNILEDDEHPGLDIKTADGRSSIKIELRAFEVATFRLQL